MKKVLILVLFLISVTASSQSSQEKLECERLNEKAMSVYTNDPDLALKLLKQAEVKSAKLKNNDLLALAISNLAILERRQGDFLESKKLAEKALKLTNLENIKASCLNNIGACNRSLGFYNDAIKNYLAALKIHEKRRDIKEQATVNNNIGMIFSTLGQLDKAKEYHQRALQLFLKLGNKKGLSESYNNMAIALANQDSVPKAIHYFRKSLRIEESLQDTKGIAESVNNIGGAHYFLQNRDSALYYFRKSVALEKSLNNITGIAQSFNNIALVLLDRKQYTVAKQYTDSAYNYSVKTKVSDDMIFTLQNYIQFYEETNNFEEANKLNKRFYKFKDSIEAIANIKGINELETKYQTNKKEKLLAENKATLLEKDIAIKNSRFIMIAIAALAFFIAFIGFLIYRQQKLKNKQQVQEFELKSAISHIETQNKLQEQRLSISRDLHDNIGAQLTFIISSVDNIKHGFNIQNVKLNSKLNYISEFTKATIIELRDTIWAMNNNEIDFEDLRARILNFTEKAKFAKENIDFNFIIDDSLNQQKLTSIAGVNIYRTIQEAVNNAIKYSDANTITIDAKSNENQMEITITDDGKGFDLKTAEYGNGLFNMQKRIEDIDGIFKINSETSKGTTVQILINKDTFK